MPTLRGWVCSSGEYDGGFDASFAYTTKGMCGRQTTSCTKAKFRAKKRLGSEEKRLIAAESGCIVEEVGISHLQHIERRGFRGGLF